MKRTRRLLPLTPSLTLCRSAQTHAQDMGATGRTGHFGSNGSTLGDRINRYGSWNGLIAENCAYGDQTPLGFLLMLLIDDGVPDRGHRRNILTPDFRYIGVGIRPHRWFNLNCVQDFAAEVTRG